MSKIKMLNDLNNEQKQAVEHTEGPSIILAGAGSGKTRVLTYKVMYLIEEKKVDPFNIVMMTFTNKAAKEMQERVGVKIGFSGTFHTFGALMLRKYGRFINISSDYVIYDEDDSISLIKNILKTVNYYKKISPNYVKNIISSAKDNLLSPDEYARFASSGMDEIVAEVYKKYQNKLQKTNTLDFDDLIFKTVKLFELNEDILKRCQQQYTHILVDEFQDTNAGQYQLVRHLGGTKGNITVVGDFAQSIYSWRGADIKNLEKFEEDFKNTQIFHLEQNYRSTQNVLDFAYDIISHNETHPVLKLYTNNAHGEDVGLIELENEEQEAVFIAKEIEKISGNDDYADIAILYRMNAQSRVIEEAFLHYGIPYVLIGGTRFYERKEIKDILSYIRVIVNPLDEVSLERIKKLGKRRFEKFNQELEKLNNAKDKLTTDEVIQKVFTLTSYLELYDENDPEDFSRIENIKELRSVAMAFPNINDFLQQVALVESEYSESEKSGKNKNGVHLMTLHQAKGLEFPFVFIIGLEEGILPHSRALYDQHEIEEERRLLYVGITRAKKKLFISYVQRRFLFGRRIYAQVSRFIEEKVREEL